MIAFKYQSVRIFRFVKSSLYVGRQPRDHRRSEHPLPAGSQQLDQTRADEPGTPRTSEDIGDLSESFRILGLTRTRNQA
jgi:hypothetical protein